MLDNKYYQECLGSRHLAFLIEKSDGNRHSAQFSRSMSTFISLGSFFGSFISRLCCLGISIIFLLSFSIFFSRFFFCFLSYDTLDGRYLMIAFTICLANSNMSTTFSYFNFAITYATLILF